MGEHETVTEVRAEAALQVAVPLALGSNVGSGVEDLLRSAEAVRHVGDVEIRSVEKTEAALQVDATAQLTVHLDYPNDGDPAASVQSVLRTIDAVGSIERLDIHEAYPIETY